MQRKRVGILIFPEVEVLDFCGPFEVLSVTRLDESRRREEPSPFELRLIAEAPDVVTATGGLRVVPDCGIADCPPLDILLVPGGWGTRPLLARPGLLEWVRARAAQAELTAAVCTGALLLAQAGLLDGRPATTHWMALDWMAEAYPAVQVLRDRHVVDDGDVVTSAGISAGIDMALRLVERYCGRPVAVATAKYMEYRWTGDNARRV